MKQINMLMLAALLLLAVVSGCGRDIPEWIKHERAQAQKEASLPASAVFAEEKEAFVLRDLSSTSTLIMNEQEADKSYPPLDTIHIPLALITGLPAEQQISEVTLAALMDGQTKKALDQLGFGHEATDGSRQITAREQVEFLSSLFRAHPAADPEAIENAKKRMTVHEQDGLLYAALSSTSEDSEWYVGYVSTKDKTYVFATHLAGKRGQTEAKAKEKTEKILRNMNILPPAMQ